MRAGQTAKGQLARLSRLHSQGQHVLITGPTGSGKTTLARHVVENRAANGGYVAVFATKLRRDETLESEYRDYTRWRSFKKRPRVYEDRVIVQADTRGMKLKDALTKQRAVFGDAMDILTEVGRWTILVDEGYYFCHPAFLGLGTELALHHAQGRSGGLTMVTLAQRPAFLPVIIYDNISHGFIGRVKDEQDRKRLVNLSGVGVDKAMHAHLMGQGLHEFTWFPTAENLGPERFNLAR